MIKSIAFAFALALAACGTDGAVLCDGASCSCTEDTCGCSAMGDCKATCDGVCGLECTQDAKCEIDGSDAEVNVDCADQTDCKANVASADVVCRHNADCDIKTTGASNVTCRDSADCKLNLGAGSEVSCEDGASCDIKCSDGCVVSCETNASCEADCGGEGEESPAMVCEDGRLVCSMSC